MTTPHEIATRTAPNPTRELRDPKLAIALSGGGFRAMLYHLGALRRLNEFGLLSVMDRLSTVSGGSLAGAVLGLHWSSLTFGTDGVAAGFDAVEREVIAIADRTIDIPSAALGFLRWTTGAAQVARRLDRRFEGSASPTCHMSGRGSRSTPPISRPATCSGGHLGTAPTARSSISSCRISRSPTGNGHRPHVQLNTDGTIATIIADLAG
jgi:hypothetical protein